MLAQWLFLQAMIKLKITMRTYLTLDGVLNQEMVNKLITKVEALGNDNLLTIYFECSGGDIYSAMQMLDILNRESSRVTLVASNYIESAAVIVFFAATCFKTIIKGTWGMIHQASRSIEHNETGAVYDRHAKFHNRIITQIAWLPLEIISRIKLTPEEKKLYDEGEEVLLSPERLAQIYEDFDKTFGVKADYVINLYSV
jgi:ATP-dependent protease ClpP protease subunit